MLFQSLEKLQKEKADEQDMMEAMDVVQSRAASYQTLGFLGRVTNAPCPLGAGGQNWPGEGGFPKLVGSLTLQMGGPSSPG